MTFQDQVYAVVRKIPKGKVLTYKEVARRVGKPKAFRAVGTVLSKNFDPKIPCHRVIRSDGKIGNYNRGGRASKMRILKSEVGDINESDVKLAQMSKAQIIGFRVKISPGVMQIMKNDQKKKVRIKTFDIIYELIQEARTGMEKSLEAETVRTELGKIKALIIFFAEKNRQIVGGKITEGEIRKGVKLEVFRGEEKIGAGRIINLQRDKKDMEKLLKGDECGILFEGNIKVEKNDILVAFVEERQKGIL